jgi:hypothetical protein
MGRKDALPRDEMVDYVMSCWDDEAGTSYTIICSVYSGTTPRGVHALRSTTRSFPSIHIWTDADM